MRYTYVLVAIGSVILIAGGVHAQPLAIVDNLPGSFTDISGDGTPLNLNDDDEAVIFSPIGNAVFPSGNIVIGNNGGVGFPSVPGQNDLAPLNQPIPSASAFNGRQAILAYWDDLDGEDSLALGEDQRGGKNGNVYYKVVGPFLIIQWERNIGGVTYIFQVVIIDGVGTASGSVYARYIYQVVEAPEVRTGSSATIGYQNGSAGFNDVQWSFNTPGAVSNGTVLSLINANPVPAVSEVGQAVMVLILLTAGALIFRRGRRLSTAG